MYLKGVNPGYATVSASVIEPGYENVSPIEVKLTIIDPVEIIPTKPVYLLPASVFKFGLDNLVITQEDKIEKYPIALPNRNYKWQVLQDERKTT